MYEPHHKPTLFERCFAAFFSACAAGLTFAVWVYFHSGQVSAEQFVEFEQIGKWAVLAGAALGFLGGISAVTTVWSHLWETRSQPLISLRTALLLIAIAAIAYGVLK